MRRIIKEVVFSRIESDDFLNKFGVLSTLSSFFHLLQSDRLLKIIEDFAKSDPDTYIKELTTRIKLLTQAEVDPEKLHPYDYAIAAYLFLISRISNKDIKRACKGVERARLKNLWWSNFMVQLIKELEKDVETQKIDSSYLSPRQMPSYNIFVETQFMGVEDESFGLIYDFCV